jgi:hypothetical protein
LESRDLDATPAVIGSAKDKATPILIGSSLRVISNIVKESVGFGTSASFQSVNLLASQDFATIISLIGSSKYGLMIILKASFGFEKSLSVVSSVVLGPSESVRSVTLLTSEVFGVIAILIESVKLGRTALLQFSSSSKSTNAGKVSAGIGGSGTIQSVTLLTSHDFGVTTALVGSK